MCDYLVRVWWKKTANEENEQTTNIAYRQIQLEERNKNNKSQSRTIYT